MNGKRSRTAILEFHDYLARKGLMNKTTAMARKATLGKVLGILSEDEAEDVTDLDVDDLMRRFTHLEGSTYTPDSLSTYKSRTKSGLDDFASYIENPMGFRPSVSGRKVVKVLKFGKTPTGTAKDPISNPSPTSAPVPTMSFAAANILPIPLRQDLVVRIEGLPFDLTEAEAKKIANVVLAMGACANI